MVRILRLPYISRPQCSKCISTSLCHTIINQLGATSPLSKNYIMSVSNTSSTSNKCQQKSVSSAGLQNAVQSQSLSSHQRLPI
ncbi:hypothetical protein HanIR_Chr08g0385831 [Helianthus annuus]|nr:hypothetical protein HanIR_Chr08g0385831 [Helianthus annuus]